MSKTTLIISDIHLDWRTAERIISSVKADEIVFLGDFFDDFDDTADMVRDTANWLVKSVKTSNRIHLIGNHDQHYMYPYRTFKCGGYADWKNHIIRDVVDHSTWNNLKWYHILDNRWLLTHAGLHKAYSQPFFTEFKHDRVNLFNEIGKWLDVEIQSGLRKAANGNGSWVFGVGRSRGGFNNVGGITWCDYEREFYPILGVNQIVGHTPQRDGIVFWNNGTLENPYINIPLESHTVNPEHLDDPDRSTNICLDVYKNMHWATWDGKQLKIGDSSSL